LLQAVLVKDQIEREGITEWDQITEMYANIQVYCDSQESGPFSKNLVETNEVMLSLKRAAAANLTVNGYLRQAISEVVPYLLCGYVPQVEKKVAIAAFRQHLDFVRAKQAIYEKRQGE
jgi:hypothetical protein